MNLIQLLFLCTDVVQNRNDGQSEQVRLPAADEDPEDETAHPADWGCVVGTCKVLQPGAKTR